MDFSKVASVAIYPAIGIARIGNSKEEYFIGPTIPGQHPHDPDDFRDKMSVSTVFDGMSVTLNEG